MKIDIITTAHWPGDPRLNRHVTYLSEAGHEVSLNSFHDRPRISAVWTALGTAFRSKAEVVLLPDPEMFVVGSLMARFGRSKPVIDIHEDYAKVARARSWVPDWARGIVSVFARTTERVGRGVAWRTAVAAPELTNGDDTLVMNIPRPVPAMRRVAASEPRMVYIGDVTRQRGAETMAAAARLLAGEVDLTVVGNVGEQLARSMKADAGDATVELAGRLSHEDAWERAAGAVAGLCLLEPFPAYRESVPTKIWEYMAYGIPPVVSDLPGQRRIVEKVSSELVCADAAEVAAVVSRLAKDPEFRSEVVAAGLELYRTTWDERRPDRAIRRVVEP